MLDSEPGDLEVLQFLAARHFERGEPVRTIERLQQAHRAYPHEPGVLHRLGTVRMAQADYAGAVADLDKVLAPAPGMFVARLRLGGRGAGAARSIARCTVAYFTAINAAIRGELRAVLGQPQDLEAFLKTDTQEQLDAMLRGSGTQQATWDGYFFYRHGQRYDVHCAACPQASALIERMPLSRIREHGPETLFSMLRPGPHIRPHRGV